MGGEGSGGGGLAPPSLNSVPFQSDERPHSIGFLIAVVEKNGCALAQAVSATTSRIFSSSSLE